MSSDESDRRSARERDARRAAVFVLLASATVLGTNATNDERGPLLWLGLVFVAASFYYATKSTFRLKSEDEPDYEE